MYRVDYINLKFLLSQLGALRVIFMWLSGNCDASIVRTKILGFLSLPPSASLSPPPHTLSLSLSLSLPFSKHIRSHVLCDIVIVRTALRIWLFQTIAN